MLRKRSLAFTMTEMIVAMAVMSMMIGAGVPSFVNAIKRGKARAAVNNLIAIHAAQKVYKANHSTYAQASSLDIANATLSLSLSSVGSTYHCGGGNICLANSMDGSDVYSLSLDLHAPLKFIDNPQCTGTACPFAASSNPHRLIPGWEVTESPGTPGTPQVPAPITTLLPDRPTPSMPQHGGLPGIPVESEEPEEPELQMGNVDHGAENKPKHGPGEKRIEWHAR